MDTTAILLVTLLTLFSVTLSNKELQGKNVLWSSLTPLQLAAMDGRVEEVEKILLENKESVNSVNSGMSALHWAALRGSVRVIGVLLRFGANVSILDNNRNTALHMAAFSGNPEAIQELALAQVDLNAQNSNNKTAIHLAVDRQYFDVVKMLLRFGARTNITDEEGKSPLDLAIDSNNIMIIALLQSSGAKKIKYAPESFGYTKTTTTPVPTMATTTTKPAKATTTPVPTVATTTTKPPKVTTTPVPTMATTTTKPPKATTTPVPTMATTKPPKVQFLKATRKPELRKLTDKEKQLHEAAKENMDDKIADLCAEGVDPNVADMSNGYTPVHLASAANRGVALIALARCYANLNAKDLDGNTPLHIAVKTDYFWSADTLLMLGALPNVTNNEGKLPKDLVKPSKNSVFQNTFEPEHMQWISGIRKLSVSEKNLISMVQNGHYINVRESCMKGIDVRVKNVDDKQYTMLHYAVSFSTNGPGTIQTLLRCGADINARDANGNTPLHIAVLEKKREAQMLLLNFGADQFIANWDGITPYQILKESFPKQRLEWYMNSMPV